MRLKLLLIPYDNWDPNEKTHMPSMRAPPLGIGTLTAYLRHHRIDVDQDDLDIRVENHNDRKSEKIDLTEFSDQQRIRRFLSTGSEERLEQLGEEILRKTNLRGYDLLGFSIIKPDTASSASMPMVLGKLIKERLGTTVIMGGTIDRISEETVLASGHVDYGIIGNCETSIGEVNTLCFCRAFEQGKDPRTIPGVKYHTQGKVQWNWKDYSREEKCIITCPTFDGLPMDLYQKEAIIPVGEESYSFRDLVIPYFFIRGCPHRCTFCPHSREQVWAAKEPDIIVEEIKKFSRKYHTRYFYFHNTAINPSYRFADSFADEMIREDVDIRWSDCGNLSPMDRQLLNKLKEAGAVRLVYGFESASPPILSYLKKPFTLDQASTIIKETCGAGIWTELDLICGFPYERESDAEATIRFLKEHAEYIMACHLNIFVTDGRFHDHPDEYGITPAINESGLFRGWSVMRYDEVYGRNWDERLRQAKHSYKGLYDFITASFVPPPGLPELFTYCDDRRFLEIMGNVVEKDPKNMARGKIGWGALKKEMLRQARHLEVNKNH